LGQDQDATHRCLGRQSFEPEELEEEFVTQEARLPGGLERRIKWFERLVQGIDIFLENVHLKVVGKETTAPIAQGVGCWRARRDNVVIETRGGNGLRCRGRVGDIMSGKTWK